MVIEMRGDATMEEKEELIKNIMQENLRVKKVTGADKKVCVVGSANWSSYDKNALRDKLSVLSGVGVIQIIPVQYKLASLYCAPQREDSISI